MKVRARYVKLANLQAGYLPSHDPYSRYALNEKPALRGEVATAAKGEKP